MPTVTQILGMRKRQEQKIQRNPASKFALGCGGILSLTLAMTAIAVAFLYARVSSNLPSVEILPALMEGENNPRNHPTRFYDRSGEHILLTLKNPYITEWDYLQYDNRNQANPPTGGKPPYLSKELITAAIASTDPFWGEHPGFNLRPRLINQTTLAQHLASEFLLAGESPSLLRSLRERLLAAQITSRFGKEKIIEWYLNIANYGNLAYGIDAAARLYFGKAASELNLAEAALLAGVAQFPALNPLDAPQATLEQQKMVIQKMLDQRLITPEEGVQAAQQDLIFQPPTNSRWYFEGGETAPAFLLMVLDQLEEQIPRDRLERGGYKVYTTLDYELQRQATCSTIAQVDRLQPNPDTVISPSCEAHRLLPTLETETQLFLENLGAEFLVLDPKRGQILALGGLSSNGQKIASFNSHPLGTLATPFVYLTAFTREMSPASLVWDIPPEENSVSLHNFDNEYNGPLRLRNAFANDYLVPVQNVMDQVGIENVWRTARQFGLFFPEPAGLNQEISLDIFGEESLLVISQAYSVFANQGIQSGHIFIRHENDNERPDRLSGQLSPLEPTTILFLEDMEGQVVAKWSEPQTRPIISPQLSYLMTHVMSDEPARWPSLGHPNALEIGKPVAAKMGRTKNGVSNWAIGYTPQLMLGIWLGDRIQDITELEPNQSRLLGQATGGLWHAIIQFASKDSGYQTFTVPTGISNVKVCDPSGLLPTEECPNMVDEVFLAGSEPVQKDNLYTTIQINRNTNRRATAFTAPDNIENRTYMIVPEQAEEWAILAGIEIPPQTYDTIPLEIPSWPGSQITSPEIFETVKGNVSIMGSASGDEFAFYRIQVGAGLNPHFWYQIGDDIDQPVRNGKLITWDTSSLNGLYAIQLLVVHQDRSVERSTSLVTIDNRSPTIRITNPSPGEIVFTTETPIIVLQAEIQDELGIEQVEFFINDRTLKLLTQPPYSVSWKTQPGTYSLRVLVSDQAGNSSEDIIEFQVK